MMTLSSSKSFLHVSLYRGSSQLSSSTAFIRTLEPYTNLVMSLKQSSIVPTDMFIKTILGIGLLMVISLSSVSNGEQIVGSQGGASMYGSSEMPSLHLKCSSIGSKGLRKVGIRQLSLALSTAAALYMDTISSIPPYILVNRSMAVSTLGRNSGGAKFRNSHPGRVCTVDVIVFTTRPSGMIGLLQLIWVGLDEDLLLIDVPGRVTSGSLNNRAVAGTVLGTTNPEFAPKAVLNTDTTTAPGNPAAKSDTSAATAAF